MPSAALVSRWLAACTRCCCFPPPILSTSTFQACAAYCTREFSRKIYYATQYGEEVGHIAFGNFKAYWYVVAGFFLGI